jgi:dihydropteroate synthase
LYAQGADLVDVGGESTRPGSRSIPAAEEVARIEPVVAGLAAAGVPVSIDTSKPEVAAIAIAAGAEAVNDVTALRNPEMTELCADSRVGVVLMHMRGTPETMQLRPRYEDVVAEVVADLESWSTAAMGSGVASDRICLDPGIGFGKTFGDNLSLLEGIGRIRATGFPVMIGTSRKGFLGKILEDAGYPGAAADRDPATAASVALAIAHGASIIRVHNVADALQSARTADAMVRHRAN